jgi:hypothetical protein
MTWRPACSCFIAAVTLARRTHPLELGRAEAKVKSGNNVFPASATFQIRGLASNGIGFAPGGRVSLSGWVSDPAPVQKEVVHFCAWVKTVDLLGVSGYPVTYVVHYPNHAQTIHARPTNIRGVSCAQRSIDSSPVGQRVTVDIYAAGQHVSAFFQPRHP